MKIRTLKQILAEENESMFVFDNVVIGRDFLRKGQTCVISGASGIGKSVLAMQLAVGFALGEKTLGLDIFKPSKTLLFNAENPTTDTRAYFNGIVSNFARKSDSDIDKLLDNNFHYADATNCYYSVDEFISKLENSLRAGNYDVVIVDSLLSLVRCDFSEHSAIANLFCKINALRSKYNVAMVFFHHFDKPNFRTKNLHPTQWCMGGKTIGIYANIMSAILEMNGESIFAFRHYKPSLGTELPSACIRHNLSGNYSWEAVKNV